MPRAGYLLRLATKLPNPQRIKDLASIVLPPRRSRCHARRYYVLLLERRKTDLLASRPQAGGVDSTVEAHGSNLAWGRLGGPPNCCCCCTHPGSRLSAQLNSPGEPLTSWVAYISTKGRTRMTHPHNNYPTPTTYSRPMNLACRWARR